MSKPSINTSKHTSIEIIKSPTARGYPLSVYYSRKGKIFRKRTGVFIKSIKDFDQTKQKFITKSSNVDEWISTINVVKNKVERAIIDFLEEYEELPTTNELNQKLNQESKQRKKNLSNLIEYFEDFLILKEEV